MLKTLLFLTLVPATALATTMAPVTLEKLIAGGDEIVRATVVKQRTSNEAGELFTHTWLKVSKSYRGDHRVGEEIVLRQAGGQQGVMKSGIVGDASFTAAEDVVLVLHHGARYHALTNLSLSKFHVEPNADGEVLIRDAHDLRFADGSTPGEKLPLAAFEQLVNGGAK